MNSREVVQRLRDDGWYLVDQTGSHLQFKHPIKSGRTTVPHPKKDLKIGTLRPSRNRAAFACAPDLPQEDNHAAHLSGRH